MAGVIKVSVVYDYETEEERKELEDFIWGTEESGYANGWLNNVCGGDTNEDPDEHNCKFSHFAATRAITSEQEEKYLDCACKCCIH